MEAIDNPTYGAADATGSAKAAGDLEAAVEEVRAEMDAKLQALRAELGAGPGAGGAASSQLNDAVRSVVAHLSEAPTNFHQALVYFASVSQEDSGDGAGRAGMVQWLPWMAISAALMVLGQIAVAAGLLVGTDEPGCANSDQCRRGAFCNVDRGRCAYCGESWQMPLPKQINAAGGTLNVVSDPAFVGFNLTLVAEICVAHPSAQVKNSEWGDIVVSAAATASWCESCVHAVDGTVDPLYGSTVMAANVQAMRPFDW